MAIADDMSGAAAIAITVLAVSGAVPTQADYARLVAFGKAQYSAYEAAGVANPALGPFEALGRSFAADPLLKVTFASINGKGSVSEFIDAAYTRVFGSVPNAAAKAALTEQVTYFDALYRSVGIATADAALQAKGAVFGQIIGYAFTDPVAGARSGLDDVVNALVAKAAAGNFADFGRQLPAFSATSAQASTSGAAPTSAVEDSSLNAALQEVFVADAGSSGSPITGFSAGSIGADLPGSGGADATVSPSGGLFVDVNGNGQNDPVGDLLIQLVGTQGIPGTADLIFA